MKRKIVLTFTAVLMAFALWAEDVQFTANAPTSVVLNEPFKLTYVVSARSKDLRAPEMKDFDVLAGPYTSTSSSTSWVNGKRTSSFEQSYTYTLSAKKEGTFSVPGATVMVDGTKYTSNGLKIKVLPPDQNAAPASQNQAANQQRSQPANSSISNENLFVRTQISKLKVHEQECILVTYRLYTLLDVAQYIGNKIPDFSGFLKQEIEQPRNAQLSLEHYNGRNYSSVVLYQTLLYPQHTGTINIEPATFDVVVRVQNRAQVRSIFDDFFDSYSNVTKTLKAAGAKIQVEALPAGKPASFSGTVGHFNISSQISANELKANEPVTVKLTISGTGNIKLLKTPALEFPAGFEVYDPKVDNQLKTTTAGVTGSKTIEYLAIPRSEGYFTIPSIEFSYFDTETNTYKTLYTPPYEINVQKGDSSSATTQTYVSKENVKSLSTDIRYIYTKPMRLQKSRAHFFGSVWHWLLYVLPALLTAFLFVFFRKQIKENADVARMKTKKASKVAQRRLKIAQKLLKENKKDAFYDEILKAAWTYVGDKLSIPTATLNKENVADALRSRGTEQQQIDEFLELLNTCEFARYAPSGSNDAMADVYKKTAALIDGMENNLK